MKKYFFTSDIHSFGTFFKDALKKAGFRKTNPEHILVVCGDVFDRGFETIEVYEYLMSLPKKRRVMIKGNHEYLYLELLEKEFPERHDFSNGTVRSFCQIAGTTEDELYSYSNSIDPSDSMEKKWLDIREKVAKSPITKWIKSNEWVNYFEIDDLICVHCFIPVQVKKISETKWIRNYPVYQVHSSFLEPVKNWRTNAKKLEWEDATWGCPYEYFDGGLFKSEIDKNPNKKLVCGHWHTSDFHDNYQDTPDIKMNLNIYFGHNLIALDACTALSNFCNVLVYDPETHKYYDQFKNELKVKEGGKVE